MLKLNVIHKTKEENKTENEDENDSMTEVNLLTASLDVKKGWKKKVWKLTQNWIQQT